MFGSRSMCSVDQEQQQADDNNKAAAAAAAATVEHAGCTARWADPREMKRKDVASHLLLLLLYSTRREMVIHHSHHYSISFTLSRDGTACMHDVCSTWIGTARAPMSAALSSSQLDSHITYIRRLECSTIKRIILLLLISKQ